MGKPLGRRALLTGSLLPPRHSAEPAPALKQQLLACEPTASHPCCGGDKGCHHPRPPPQPGLPLEGLGQGGGAGAAEMGFPMAFPGGAAADPQGSPAEVSAPPSPEVGSAGAAPRLAPSVPRSPRLCSVQPQSRDPRPTGERAPSSGRPAVSSPGSTTPAFLGEGPRKFAFSSSGGHDLRNATRRSPLCFKKQDLGEDKSISTPSAVDHRSWKSE